MEIRLATLGRRTTRKHAAAEDLFAAYCTRIQQFSPSRAESFLTEERFFQSLERGRSATGPISELVLLDSRGRTFASEQFAAWLQRQRENSVPRLTFAVGPANGWSAAARARAGLLLSLGPLTLPHELAAVVLAEQLYRAFTIIEGHPYHLGHSS